MIIHSRKSEEGALSSDWRVSGRFPSGGDLHRQGSAGQSWMRNETAMQGQEAFGLLEVPVSSSKRQDPRGLGDSAVDWTGKESLRFLDIMPRAWATALKSHITTPVFTHEGAEAEA